MKGDLVIFAGSSNRALAEEICRYLKIPVGEARLTTFSDGELYFQSLENVRGRDVFIIQSTSTPVNTHLMELLIMIDACKRASASRITAVVPYYGYARQDRKDKPRVPISSKLVADLLTAAGTHRVLTMDLHAAQIQGFFDIPVDHLFSAPVILEYISAQNFEDVTILSPDTGGAERARAYAKRLNAGLAIGDKRRVQTNVAEVMHIIGEVEDKTVIIIDDMIDTAGTMVEIVSAIQMRGARRILAGSTHAVLSGPAMSRLRDSALEEVIVTNTIALPEAKQFDKLKVLSVAPLFGEAIRSIHYETSISNLFV
ncbi:MAG: ribose-phosphate pyrophosphokinase [Acidobacteria bacterium]|nr:ribose-phosphate pyrophosphokinase [Acidobacteriota bacterium]